MSDPKTKANGRSSIQTHKSEGLAKQVKEITKQIKSYNLVGCSFSMSRSSFCTFLIRAHRATGDYRVPHCSSKQFRSSSSLLNLQNWHRPISVHIGQESSKTSLVLPLPEDILFEITSQTYANHNLACLISITSYIYGIIT